MGRAHGQGRDSSSSYRHQLAPLEVALVRFNEAASRRAHLSRLVFDISDLAASQSCSRLQPSLVALDKSLNLRPSFAKETRISLHERAHLELHSRLHRLLDEGRRLTKNILEGCADEAVAVAASSLLGERVEEIIQSLDLPLTAAKLSASEWDEILRSLFISGRLGHLNVRVESADWVRKEAFSRLEANTMISAIAS